MTVSDVHGRETSCFPDMSSLATRLARCVPALFLLMSAAACSSGGPDGKVGVDALDLVPTPDIANCDDDNPCTDDFLKADGSCAHLPLGGQTCDDGNACTAGDQCNEDGVCVGSSAVGCDDGNPCTSDGCDALSGCTHEQVADGTSCDDGNNCTLEDSCQSGVCKSASMVECDDVNPFDCTYKVCNKLTGACDTTQVHPEGHPCSDGNACTDNDQCDADGACESGDAHTCDAQHPCKTAWCNPEAQEGANPCQSEWKEPGIGCDDGDACTTEDHCIEKDDGTMKCSGNGLDCSDDNPCTSDSCDEEAGCQHVTLSDGMPCSVVGNACISEGTCEGGDCVGTMEEVCDDDNPCTDDTCDSETGDCVFVPNTNECDDGSLCTTEDLCSGGTCKGDTVVCPDELGPCMLDTCNPDTGLCDLPVEDGFDCSDDDLCNGAETCQAGVCAAGESVDCSNLGNPCLEPECNPETGLCDVPVEDGTACADEDLCNGEETCVAGSCVGGDPVDCSGLDAPCLAKQCNPATGLCDLAVEDGTGCDDGDACTDDDTCQGGACIAGPELVCNDGNGCTDDMCDAVQGCVYPGVEDGTVCAEGEGACTQGICVAIDIVCGETVCPALSGYYPYCNASGYCEYERKEIVEDWQQWDVWIYLPPDTVDVGSPGSEVGRLPDEGPDYHAQLEIGFFIAKYEGVVLQYEECVTEGACSQAETGSWDGAGWGTNSSDNGRSDHPQNSLSWHQARDFCGWLAPAGRLPSEAEWEYAAAGPVHSKYPWASDDEPSCENGLAVMNSGSGESGYGCGEGGTWPVNSKADALSHSGARHMAGNAYEWVEDCYHPTFDGAPFDGGVWDYNCPGDGQTKVKRGGAFYHESTDLRVARRGTLDASSHPAHAGVRCVRPLVEEACGGVDCPELQGYYSSCNQRNKCEYRRIQAEEPWHKWDVWIHVPPGTFMMGSSAEEPGHSVSEEPVHPVEVLSGYFVGKYEVTVAQYSGCALSSPDSCSPPTSSAYIGCGVNTLEAGMAEYPQNGLNWYQAKAVCSWLGGRLPSESEWEYAASGPVHTVYPWGDTPVPTCGNETAVFDGDGDGAKPWACEAMTPAECNGSERVGTKTVGASWSGALDVSGNLSEWCADAWHDDYSGAPQTQVVWNGPHGDRVQRGGHLYSADIDIRTSRRGHDPAGNGGEGKGVRCVRDLELCLPGCAGKQCGDDGCGGSCGSCDEGEFCSQAGFCGTEEDWGGVWVQVPGGSFTMGCSAGDAQCEERELPPHAVDVGSFYIMDSEVTQAHYETVIGGQPSAHIGCSNCPVESVTWYESQAFCEAVGGRLPTEAEWEFAARAGTETPYYCGEAEGCVDGIAWHSANSDNGTHESRSKTPNPYGLYDMSGNVWEWVQDCRHNTYDGAPDYGFPAWDDACHEDGRRVERGGSYVFDSADCRVSARAFGLPYQYDYHLGFRCAKDVCVPDCAGKECGNDGCGGSCGECAGQDMCVDDQCLCQSYCEGKQCGDDGCGGNCGECAAAMICDADSLCADEYGIVWIKMLPGDFMMGCSIENDYSCGDGSGCPRHSVHIDHAFYMAQTETTQAQFAEVMAYNPSNFIGCPNCPVENVTWSEANEFCMAVGGRLPSEAEWEYSGRAGTIWRHYCSQDITDLWCLTLIAWYASNSQGVPHPAKLKDPNAWDIYDMVGNVWEFVQDTYHYSHAGVPYGGGAWVDDSTTNHVIRGGAFGCEVGWNGTGCARLDTRAGEVGPSPGIGFRCAMDICIPNCTDKQCGDDGCGGSCGECVQGHVCHSGICGPEDGTPCDDENPNTTTDAFLKGLCTAGMVAVPSPGAAEFWIDATETTQREYQRFLQWGIPSEPVVGCEWNDSFHPVTGFHPEDTPLHPVVGVDWCDAQAYCSWAGKRLCSGIYSGVENIATTYGDWTVSEWFYACSNGGQTEFPYGNEFGAMACNTVDGPADESLAVASLVQCHGGIEGLFDMSGNVQEWTAECDENYCLARGGGFNYKGASWPDSVKCAPASGFGPVAPETKDEAKGLRCCRDADEPG